MGKQVAAGKIVVLGTGGTIAGRSSDADDTLGYVAGQIAVDQLLGGIAVPPDCEVVAEQVAQLDSKDMSFEVWSQLATRCAHWLDQPGVSGLVITHGTDTMEETAYFLHRVLAAHKPVVLTGAMLPATAREPDGPGNLADALAVVASPDARGVVVVFAGAVHDPVTVAKVYTDRVAAFDSGEAGPIARIAQGQVHPVRPWPAVAAVPASPVPGRWPRVEIVMNHAGTSGALVDAVLAQGIDGIVVAATGHGSVHHALEAALRRAQARGVEVVRASRCARGQVFDKAGDTLAHAGTLSPVKARIDLLLALAA